MLNIGMMNSIKAVVTVLVIAAFFYLGVDYWFFEWIALIASSLYALRVTKCKTFLGVFIAYFLGCLNPHYILPVIVYCQMAVIYSALFSGIFVLLKILSEKNMRNIAILISASALVVMEYCVSLLSHHGTVTSIAYTQTDNLLVAQIAAITGLWGISFILIFISIQVAFNLYDKAFKNFKSNLLGIGLVIFVAVWGFYRLYGPSDIGEEIPVGIASVNINLQDYIAISANKNEDLKNKMLQEYVVSIESLARAGAKYILLPEKIETISSLEQLSIFKEVAEKNNVVVILGVSEKNETNLKNQAYVIDKKGNVLGVYAKHHLQTTYEKNYLPGEKITLWDQNKGLEICKDMDFTYPSLEYSKMGVGVMFVPALDFHDDAEVHKRVAIIRGIEGGFSVVRAAQWGSLSISDDRGRQVSTMNVDEVYGSAELVKCVKLGEGHSLYSKIENFFVL